MRDSGHHAAALALGEEPPPSTIDRYQILRKLATGGMAELFLAKQSGLEGFEKVVVIKRILSHLAQDEEFVSMFLDEARIAAKLSHPNIVQIYDLGKDDDSYYIAMEYVSGRNVQHVMTKQFEQGQRIPVEHACRIIAGVCEGLHYAHSRKDYDGRALNIVHRDISPQNILVSFAGGVKVVDFGIAKASTQLAETRAGVLKGKYAYMSPEQVRGQKIDHRSDLFAVGLVFYEMLTGRRAFERESSIDTLKAIVQDKPLNPKELNPAVTSDVIKLLSRALEKNPERRYKNAQEFQLAIEDYLESSPKKSNNVRLSQYLYQLFDDELNSESGTLSVEGVGQIIIPTGVKPAERKEVIDEEIDAKTLSAALMPEAPPGRREADTRAPEQTDGRRRAESSAQVVRSEIRASSDATPSSDSDVGLDSDEDSADDKTIPVYSMDDYERQRAERRPGTPEKAPSPNTPAVDDGSFESVPTLGALPQDQIMVSTTREPSLSRSGATFPGTDENTQTVDHVRAADLLAKVEEMAERAGLSTSGAALAPAGGAARASSAAPGDLSASAATDRWDLEPAGTGARGAGRLGLHSDEAVIGPDGVVSVPDSGAAEVRPAASPDVRRDLAAGGIRPAATPGLRPPVPPERSEPSTRSQPAAIAPAGIGLPVSPPVPPAQTLPPKWLFAALGAMLLFVLMSIAGVVLLFVLEPEPAADGALPATFRILRVSAAAPNVQITYGAITQTSPAQILVAPGTVALTVTAGDTQQQVTIEVPPGDEPYDYQLEFPPSAR